MWTVRYKAQHLKYNKMTCEKMEDQVKILYLKLFIKIKHN
jgi:hypothetical protein